MAYTLGQAAKAVGISKTTILRSIRAGRISAGRDEFNQWAIEPCELHRVYPALTDDNGAEEQAETGHETALAEGIRASLLEQRISDLKGMLDDMRAQRDDMRGQRDAWQRQAETSQRALTDQREKATSRSWWGWLRATA